MKEKFQYLGFAFVDDTNNCATGETPEDAIQNMQELNDGWDVGARLTGGKLVSGGICTRWKRWLQIFATQFRAPSAISYC